jgi:excisionase family DNA binding protein
MIKERFVRPSEVAIQLGVSRSTVYRWFWEGKLKGIKFSDKNIRISINSVEKIISDCW